MPTRGGACLPEPCPYVPVWRAKHATDQQDLVKFRLPGEQWAVLQQLSENAADCPHVNLMAPMLSHPNAMYMLESDIPHTAV